MRTYERCACAHAVGAMMTSQYAPCHALIRSCALAPRPTVHRSVLQRPATPILPGKYGARPYAGARGGSDIAKGAYVCGEHMWSLSVATGASEVNYTHASRRSCVATVPRSSMIVRFAMHFLVRS